MLTLTDKELKRIVGGTTKPDKAYADTVNRILNDSKLHVAEEEYYYPLVGGGDYKFPFVTYAALKYTYGTGESALRKDVMDHGFDWKNGWNVRAYDVFAGLQRLGF